MSRQVVIFAAEGVMAQEAVETLNRLDIAVAAAVITANPEWDMMGLANVIDVASVSDKLAELPVIVPVWIPQVRKMAVARAKAAGFSDFMTLVDPTAIVAQSARLGKGVAIHSSANVGAGVTIGDFALINRGALVSHHCILDEYVTTGSGIRISSRCHVKAGAILGAGSIFIPNRNIGENAIVGAGAVVINHVDANTTNVGNPARVVAKKSPGPPRIKP